MPKQPQALAEMPPAVHALLRELGSHLTLARKRRRESLKTRAGRIGVSQPTLARMERGDPGVAAGIYATALWMIGRGPAIAELAAPQFDLGALEQEVRVARARSVRKPVSLEARLRDDSSAAGPSTARLERKPLDAASLDREPGATTSSSS